MSVSCEVRMTNDLDPRLFRPKSHVMDRRWEGNGFAGHVLGLRKRLLPWIHHVITFIEVQYVPYIGTELLRPGEKFDRDMQALKCLEILSS